MQRRGLDNVWYVDNEGKGKVKHLCFENLKLENRNDIDQTDLQGILSRSQVESVIPDVHGFPNPCIADKCRGWAREGRLLCPNCIEHGVPEVRAKRSRGRVR